MHVAVRWRSPLQAEGVDTITVANRRQLGQLDLGRLQSMFDARRDGRVDYGAFFRFVLPPPGAASDQERLRMIMDGTSSSLIYISIYVSTPRRLYVSTSPSLPFSQSPRVSNLSHDVVLLFSPCSFSHTHTHTHTLVHTESHRETGLDYRQVLERLAPGRDGRVTLPDIVASLLELSPHLGEDEAEAMVRHIHAGEDGRLPLGEFLALSTPPGPAEHALESKLRSVFTEIQVRLSQCLCSVSR